MTRAVCVVVIAIMIGCYHDPIGQPIPATPPSQRTKPPPPQVPVGTNANAVTENSGMSEELINFIQSPDRESYLTLRETVISSDKYEPYSDELDTACELLEQEKFEDASDTIQNAMSNLLLSPRAHQLLGFIHYKLGNEKAAQIEMMIGFTCIDGILATGDGSTGTPYIVVRTSDEHDVIEHLEKQFKQQSLIHRDGRLLDLIECTDGSKYWFDITDAYNHMAKTLEQAMLRPLIK